MAGPRPKAPRSRSIEYLEKPLFRENLPFLSLEKVSTPSVMRELRPTAEVRDLRNFQRRFAGADHNFSPSSIVARRPPSRAWTESFKGAFDFFREIYRRWSSGPHGFLLMGASFLLADRSSFQAQNPLDRYHPMVGGELLLRDYLLPFRQIEDALRGFAIRTGQNGIDLWNVLPGTEIWLFKNGEFRRLDLGEVVPIQAGDIFVLGEKPRRMDRGGFTPKSSTVFQLEQFNEEWRVREMAHAEEQALDYQVAVIIRAAEVTEESARKTALDLKEQLEQNGWDESQIADVLGKDILDPNYIYTRDIFGENVLPLIIPFFESLTELMRTFREKSWKPEDSYRIMKVLAGKVGPEPIDEKLSRSLSFALDLGLEMADVSRMLNETVIRHPAPSFEFFFGELLERSEDLVELTGMDLNTALSLSLDSLDAFPNELYAHLIHFPEKFDFLDQTYDWHIYDSLVDLVDQSGFSPQQIGKLVRSLGKTYQNISKIIFQKATASGFGPENWSRKSIAEAFEETLRAHRAGEEPPAAQNPPFLFRHSAESFLQKAADFAAFLNKFSIPAEKRLEFIEEVFKAYGGEIDAKLEFLMSSHRQDFYLNWKTTFGGFIKKLKAKREQKQN